MTAADPLALSLAAARAGIDVARAVVLSGEDAGASLTLTATGEQAGTLGSPAADQTALELLRTRLAQGAPERLALEVTGRPEPLQIFVDVVRPPERLIIVGAVHMAVALAALANTLGYATVVVDSRSAFATPARFGHAAQLMVRWPADALEALALRPSDALVFLTHDAKIDNPALALALRSPARYIGALGSRKTHAARLSSLREDGVPEAALARIHAPIGLNLGGRSPEEIALAILAQIVLTKHRPA